MHPAVAFILIGLMAIFIIASILLLLEGIISVDVTKEYPMVHAVIMIVSGASTMLEAIYIIVNHLSKLN